MLKNLVYDRILPGGPIPLDIEVKCQFRWDPQAAKLMPVVRNRGRGDGQPVGDPLVLSMEDETNLSLGTIEER
jgi:hypothetical protein